MLELIKQGFIGEIYFSLEKGKQIQKPLIKLELMNKTFWLELISYSFNNITD